ncbi:MAG TPA: glutamate synthase-related protein, partial [Agriterribacter sp.]|nr:glutamate synthase-related protein [Agriterribacter sp.]
GLAFVHNMLVGFGIRRHIKVIASGKILSGFHILRALALGADGCNSARAMMMAIGCIQALLCNTNRCPTGASRKK